jgi:hypothetical protein
MIKDSGDGLTNGPFLKPLTGTRAHRGTVYITAGISGEARGGTLDHPSTRVPLNRTGFLIVDVDGATLRVRFFNESGVVADEFTMEKRDVPTGWRITSIQLDSGCANLAWQSDPGKTYSVLWTPSLAAPEWRVIASGLTATNGTTCWTVPLAPATPTGFYQVSCD